MSTKTNSKRFAVILFALMALVSLGCGGGGGDDAVATSTNTRAPSLEVSPADFQFDTVTDDNTVSPLEVSLKNTGSAALVVSEIALTGPDAGQFVLDATAGTDPCGSTAPEIAAGGSCNVVVEFVPLSTGSFNADLTIASNDAGSPYNLALQGNKEDINAIDVQINQIQACPRNPATVYVSVTDQSGFVISDLQASDFALAENGGSAAAPTTSGYVPSDGSASISVALVMDYSGSITMDENNVTDMENAAKNFVSQLGSGD